MKSSVGRIARILGRRPIAQAVCHSISAGLNAPEVQLVRGTSVWDVFDHSLKEAIRDIENHPRGQLFKRLIEYGPHDTGRRRVRVSDGTTVLSDPECELAVDFIFSHMVNRFKGELAELLAIEPCLLLMRQLRTEGTLDPGVQLLVGDLIGERRRRTGARTRLGPFAKGADGLLIKKEKQHGLTVLGIIEVKSMAVSRKRLRLQVQRHQSRLRGGLRLGEKVYDAHHIYCDPSQCISIMVLPSRWKLDRRCRYVKTDTRKFLEHWEIDEPPVAADTARTGRRSWKITLAWSEEAIEQAAYEMTYWYMSQVGKHIYSTKPLPKGWENMTSEEAGYNAIKSMLYYFPLRPLSGRHANRAIKLYNVYGFGYPQGTDSKEMLWPEDLSTYRLSTQALTDLREAGVAEVHLRRLHTMLDQTFTGATGSLCRVKRLIGKELTKKHKGVLLKCAEVFAEVE